MEKNNDIVLGRITLSENKMRNLVALLDEGWSLNIKRIPNGYIIQGEDLHLVIEDIDGEAITGRDMLYEVMEYFNLQGSKHDKERIYITVRGRKGDTKVPQ